MEAFVEVARQFHQRVQQPMAILLSLLDVLLQTHRGVAAFFQIALIDFATVVFVDVTAVEHARGELDLVIFHAGTDVDAKILDEHTADFDEVMEPRTRQALFSALNHWNLVRERLGVLGDERCRPRPRHRGHSLKD